MFKSWRKATAGSTAGRIGRSFHRVLSRVALPAVLIAALVATPLQILTDPGAVQAESAGVGMDLQNIPDRLAQTEEVAEPILVSFAETEYRAIEGGQEVQVTVNVSAAPDPGTFEIPIAVMNTNLEDQFTLTPMTVTMQTGQTQATFAVTATDDEEDDGDHNLLLTFGSNLPEGVALGTPNITTVRLVDDDGPGIQISLIKQTVHEDTTRTAADAQADAATWTVQLTEAPSPDETVTVAITSSDPGAATVSPATLTFEAGANSWDQTQDVTVTGAEDFDFNDEMVTFSHSASGANYGGAEARTVRVSVTDNDTPAIRFSPTGLRLLEESGRALYRVSLNGRPASRVQINIHNPDKARLTISTERLVWEPHFWDRWFNVYVTAKNDEDLFDNGFSINHTTEGSADFAGVSAQLPIYVEDDDKPGIKVSTLNERIGEDGTATWQVELNTQPTADVVVTVTNTDPGAVEVSRPADPNTLTFTPRNWNSPQSVTVRGVDDGDVGEERVTINHSAAGGDYSGLSRSVLVVVEDDEAGQAGIMLSATHVNVDENGSNMFDVSLVGGAPVGTVTIAVTSSDTEKVTVDDDTDSLVFDGNDDDEDGAINWKTPQTVTINAPDEQSPGDDEDETGITINMTATASSATGPFHELSTSVNVTVVDDDKPGIKIDTLAIDVLEGTTQTDDEASANSATWSVSLNTAQDDGEDVGVRLTSTNPNAVLLSTQDSGDPAATLLITFTLDSYNTAVAVIATGVDDDNFISEQDVLVTHQVTTNNYDAPARNVRVSVADTESPTVLISNVQAAMGTEPNKLTINEGTERHKLSFSLSHRPTGDVRLRIPNPDPDRLDFSTNLLVFRPGGNEWAGPHNLYITADDDDGDTEDNSYRITYTATGGSYDGVEAVLELIVEDSGRPGITVSQSVVDLYEGALVETGDTITYTVSLKTKPSADVIVTVGAIGDNTGAISVDQPANPNTLTFTPQDWNDPQDVVVSSVRDDNSADVTTTIQHSVSSTDTNYVHNDETNNINRNVTVNVLDVDLVGFVVNTEDGSLFPPEVDEGGSLVLEVTLLSEPSADVTVTVTTDPVAADIASYATVSGGPLTFSPGNNWDDAQDITIRGVDDSPDREDNFFGIRLRISGGGYDEVDDIIFAVKIADNDKLGIQVAPNALTVLEGTNKVSDEENAADAKWTVRLNTEPAADEVIKVTINNPNPDLVTIDRSVITFTLTGSGADEATWNQAVDVNVTAETDTDFIDNDVTFTHTATGGDYATEGVSATVKVTVTDVESPSLLIGQVQPPATAGEPYKLTINEGAERYKLSFSLSHQPTGDVRLTIPNPDSDKLEFSTNLLVFRPGGNEWSQPHNVYVTAKPDDDLVNETFTITYTPTGGSYDVAESVLELTVEDSGKAGLVVSQSALTLDEGGEDGSFTVRLKTEPDENVTVTVSATGDTTKISVDEPDDPDTLLFTPANYDEPQTVKVSTVDDDDILNQSATVTLAVTSNDEEYNHRATENEINRDVSVTVNDDEKAGFTLSTTTVNLNEDDSNVQNAFTIVLDAQPQGRVEFTITSSDTARIDNVTGPNFTGGSGSDWETAQGVELDPLADADDSEDNTVVLTITSSAMDENDTEFDGLEATVTVNIADVNKTGIKVTPTELTVEEGTSTGMYNVSLNTDPGAGNTVKVTISSSNPGSATVNPAEIDFTTDNFGQEGQEVTVTAESDDDFISNIVYLTHSSTAEGYAGVSATVKVTATDVESPSLLIGQVQAPTETEPAYSLSINEGADRYKISFSLSHQPTGDVRLTIPNPDSDKLEFSTNLLVFRPGGNEWAGPHNLYVKGLNDDDLVNETFTITYTPTGGSYDVAESVLELTVEDSGKAGLVVSQSALTLDEGGEDGSFTVRLKTEPDENVTVTVSATGDTTKISVDEPDDPDTLLFTPANYDEPQTVKVSTVDDDDILNQSATVTLAVTSNDEEYNHRATENEINRDVSVTVNDDEKAGFTLSTTTVNLNEDDSNVQNAFTIVLDAQPQGRVEFTITSSDTARIDNVTGPNFTGGSGSDWETAQGVELDPLADADDSEDNTVVLTITSSAMDENDTEFDGLEATVTVNIADVNKTGIKVTPTELTVEEGTSTGMYNVSLNTDPGAGNTVKVTISSSNPGSATVNPAEIDFTTDNFGQEGQEVTVTAESDDDFISNIVYLTHSSTAEGYAGVSATVKVTATDVESPSLLIGQVQAPTETEPAYSLSINEGADRYKISFSLSHQPTGDVRLTIPNPDSDKLEFSTNLLVFRPGGNEWAGPHNLYVKGLNDDDLVNETFTITYTPTGGSYDVAESVLELTVEDSGKAGLVVSQSALTLDEGGEDGSFTVRLKTEPDENVTVTVSATGDTTKISVDEPDDPDTLLFTPANYDEPQTVKVSTVDDDDILNQSATVTLAVTSNDEEYNHRATENEINRDVSVTVNDDEKAGFTLSTTTVNLNEDDSNVQNAFTIVLDAQPQGRVEFTITSSDDARLAAPTGPNFSGGIGSDWDTVKGVELDPLADADDSEDNTVVLTITSVATAEDADAAFNGLEATVTVNIADVNKTGIKVTPTELTVEEGTSTGMYNVSLNTDPGANNTVKVTISSSNPGSATVNPAELDFTSSNYSGQGMEVTVTAENDSNFQDNDVYFTHSSTAEGYAGVSATVKVTATDSETATIRMHHVQPPSGAEPNRLSIDEGTERYKISFSLSHQPTGDVRLTIPNPDTDRLEFSTNLLVFRPGGNDWAQPHNVYVTAKPDGDSDDNMFTITYTPTGGSYDDAESVLELTVEDTGKPAIKLSMSNATITEGQTITYDVSLATKPAADVTVNVGATSGNDEVTVTAGTVGVMTFTPDTWNRGQTVTVVAKQDDDLANEMAVIGHTGGGSTEYVGLSRDVSITINDDDTASLVLEGLTNGGLTVKEANNQVTATFMVKLSAEPADTVTVAVTKSGSDDVTIASGGDSLSFSTGDYGTAREVTINVAADDDSNNESATITLTASGAEFAGKTASVAVSVIDDEVPGLRVSTSEVTIDQEDGGTVTFMVQLNTQPTGDVTVTIESRDTGAVTVTTPDPATLTFTTANYNLDQPVTITSVDDDDVGDESVDIVVSSSGANYGNLSTTVKVNVTDADDGNLVFEPTTTTGVTVRENSSVTYTVRLSHGPNANVTVSLASEDTAIATVSPASLTFTTGNWQQTQTVTVTGADDMDAENGTTHIKNTATGGGYEITDGNDTQMGVTVTDDDQPEIIVSTDKLTVHEGSDASFRVRLKTMPSGNVTVNVTGAVAANLTIKSGASLTFTSGNYGTDQTVTLTGVEESGGTENVINEEVTLTIESSGADYGDATDKMVVVTVDDNDTLTYSFTQDSYSGDEGGPVAVLLNLNIAPGEVKVFTLQVLHVGGASTADYRLENSQPDTESKFLVTFSADETTEAISVHIYDNDGLDPGESISFVVIKSAGVKAGSPNATSIRFGDTDATDATEDN